jgi:hypothetical protein
MGRLTMPQLLFVFAAVLFIFRFFGPVDGFRK